MEGYTEGWNEAILEILRRIEAERDHAYAMEKWIAAKNDGRNALIHGYRADGLRDMADIVRAMLRIPHMQLPTDEWCEPLPLPL